MASSHGQSDAAAGLDQNKARIPNTGRERAAKVGVVSKRLKDNSRAPELALRRAKEGIFDTELILGRICIVCGGF